jgi:hypothetical protein
MLWTIWEERSIPLARIRKQSSFTFLVIKITVEYIVFERTFELVVSWLWPLHPPQLGLVRAGIAARPFRNLATIGVFPKF